MAVRDIYNAIILFDAETVAARVQTELDAGTGISDIINNGLIAAMDEIGDRFSRGDLFVPEMLMAAKIMKQGLEIVKPLLSSDNTQSKGTVVIGTVQGDLHDIGKNLVIMMMEGAGFTVKDLGVDVKNEDFIKAVAETHADVLALSALLTTTMPAMASAVKAVKESGLPVKTIVGGAPVTREFASEIGADGFSADAPGAVKLVKEFAA